MPEFEIGTHFCVLLEKNIPQNAQELCVLPTDKVKIKWFLILHVLHKHAKKLISHDMSSNIYNYK